MCSGVFSLFDVDETPESLVIYSVSETVNDLKGVLEGYDFSISVISLEGSISFISSSSLSHYKNMDVKGYKNGAKRLSASVDQEPFTECMLRNGLVNNRFKIFFDDLYSGYISYVFALKDSIANKVWGYVEIVVEAGDVERSDIVGLDEFFSTLERHFSKACKSLWDLQAALYFCNKSESGMLGKQYVLYAFDGELLYYTERIPFLLSENKLSVSTVDELKVCNSKVMDKEITFSQLDEKFENEWAFSLNILGGPEVICVNVPD